MRETSRNASNGRDAFVAEIHATLGYAPDPADIVLDKMVRFPTSHRRRDDAGWCRLFVDQRGGVFGDHRTGLSTTWVSDIGKTMTPGERADAARAVHEARRERQAQQQLQHARQATINDRLYSQTIALRRGDPVARYLANRGIDLWPLPDCLRLHQGLRYYDAGRLIDTFPVMIAPIVTGDGRLVALHRTYLTPDGHKAPVPTPKKLTSASGPLAGASIPLGRLRNGVIGIAEGIETALAARSASGMPVAAAYCASNLASWRWPAGTSCIVIFNDNDAAGRGAALSLKHRAAAANIGANILTPTEPGADWCDVWSQRDAAEVFGAST